MISQSAYQCLCASQSHQLTIAYITENRVINKIIDELKQFVKPYILVIHQPSGRGFYLDRQYQHIVDVTNCQEPKNPTEVARHHLCPSTNLPAWVDEIEDNLSRIDHCNNFDSFWLY